MGALFVQVRALLVGAARGRTAASFVAIRPGVRYGARAVAALAVLVTTPALAQLGAPVAPMPQLRKEEGPSLEQAIEWLQGKFAAFQRSYTFSTGDVSTYRSEMLFSGCVATFIRRQDRKQRDGTTYREYQVSEVPLANVKAVTAGEYRLNDHEAWGAVHVETHGTFWGTWRGSSGFKFPPTRVNGRNLTQAEWEPLTRRVPDLEDEKRQVLALLATRKEELPLSRETKMTAPVQDVETAERIANALRHASGICKQRAADEASRETAKKPKELF